MGETWVVLADSIRELRRDFQLGCLMMETQDFKGAEHRWRIANDLGEPKARPLEIAEMLWHRNFPAEARSWFERAAQEGSQWGASRLGDLLDSQGDHAEADYWRRIAALQKKVSRRLKATTPNNDSNICTTRETLIRRMDVQRSVTVTIKIDQHSN
jgi:hypothetical protein